MTDEHGADEPGTNDATREIATDPDVRLVGGRYELGELIGFGGMAEVHLGSDVRLGRDVAIKVLRADLAKDPSFLKRFRREAQSSAGLNHPAIVSVFDTGEDLVSQDGEEATVPYIVMEYVEGRTLRDVLRAEGRLPARRAMEVVAEMCGALDFSHRNGIIHRDVKPANVMVTPTGAIKVMDFGIARAIANDSATVTQTAAVIGTAQYLSPEQARGEAVDARSDVYAAGCVLYELLTGHPPFTGDSPVAVAYQHVREAAAVPSSVRPDVPRALDSIVMKALAKNPLNRYQSAAEMRTDLQRAIAGKPVDAEAVFTDEEKTQLVSRIGDSGPLSGPLGGLGRDLGGKHDSDDRRSAIVWVAVVAALLMVIAAGAYAVVFFGKDDGPKQIAVPSVIGRAPDDAVAYLRGLGFNPTANPEPYGGACGDNPAVIKVVVEKGRVCTQDPPNGTTRPEGSVITLTKYEPATVRVDAVEGKLLADAKNLLETKGFKVVEKPVENGAPTGTVISQKPAGGQNAAPGSTVTLMVSTGKLKFPDLKGKTRDEAVKILTEKGWTNVTTPPRDTPKLAENDRVIEQSVSVNSAVPLSTPVILTIGHYVEPPPTCTTPPPSPSTTPPTGTATASSSTPVTTPPSSPSSTGLPSCSS